MTFTPQELAAQDEAFAIHKQGRCTTDCGFCYDLFLSDCPSHKREYTRIQDINGALLQKQARTSRGKMQTQRVGKGHKAPLAGRVRRRR